MSYSTFNGKRILIEFLTTSFQNVKSKERTNRLHKAVLDEVLNANPDLAELRWEYEYQLEEDAFGGTFDLDIVGFNADNEIKIVILDKAYQSNIGKNMKNYVNTSIGESARVFYSPLCEKIEKIMFVNVMPRVAPRFTKDGLLEGFDNVVSYKERCKKVEQVLDRQYNGLVKVIDLFYDIAGVRSLTQKEQFQEIAVENLDEMVCQ